MWGAQSGFQSLTDPIKRTFITNFELQKFETLEPGSKLVMITGDDHWWEE